MYEGAPGGRGAEENRDEVGQGEGERIKERPDAPEHGDGLTESQPEGADGNISREDRKMETTVILPSTTEFVNAEGETITAADVEKGSMVTVETDSTEGAVKYSSWQA